jgi:hypothetical protein
MAKLMRSLTHGYGRKKEERIDEREIKEQRKGRRENRRK